MSFVLGPVARARAAAKAAGSVEMERAEQADQMTAERAARLAELRGHAAFPELVKLAEDLYAQAESLSLEVTGPQRDELSGYRAALRDLFGAWAGSLDLGRAAMTRMLQRRFPDTTPVPGARRSPWPRATERMQG